MAFDVSRVVSTLGDEAIGKVGEQVGLEKETSVRVTHALVAHSGLGNQEMVRAAAADTGLSEDVVSDLLKKLGEAVAEKAMKDTGLSDAIDNAKQDAMAALGNAGGNAARNAGGLLGGLFGRK